MNRVRTLTMNPALDLSAATDLVVPTEKLRCRAVRRDAGGGGINVARVVKRLGGEVEAVVPLGGHCGDVLAQLMRQENLIFRPVPIVEETREDFTILDEGAGRQYRFVLPGPSFSEAELRACLAAATDGAFEIACASGSLPPGAPADLYARLAWQCRQKDRKFLLDTAEPALGAALKAPIYLIKPNLKELGAFLGVPLNDRISQVEACQLVLREHPLEAVALSLGSSGALLVTRQHAWHAQTPEVRPVSTVGAGDSFMGGLVWALATGLSPEDMLRCAVAAGTAAVMTPGTELCHAPDVWRLRRRVQIQEIPLTASVNS